jgi:hypothetical protein
VKNRRSSRDGGSELRDVGAVEGLGSKSTVLVQSRDRGGKKEQASKKEQAVVR